MFGIEMESVVNIVLLTMAGFLFLGACVLVFWFLRRVVHRRQWFLLGGAFFILAILAVMFIYQQTIVGCKSLQYLCLRMIGYGLIKSLYKLREQDKLSPASLSIAWVRKAVARPVLPVPVGPIQRIFCWFDM